MRQIHPVPHAPTVPASGGSPGSGLTIHVSERALKAALAAGVLIVAALVKLLWWGP